jgi:hypothetical protein
MKFFVSVVVIHRSIAVVLLEEQHFNHKQLLQRKVVLLEDQQFNHKQLLQRKVVKVRRQ